MICSNICYVLGVIFLLKGAFAEGLSSICEKQKVCGEEQVLLTERPANFVLKAEVACVLPFIEGDRVLLLQRISKHPQGNLWTAPGGKVKDGELPLFAAARELKEETGIIADPSSMARLGTFYVRYPNGDFIFHLFKVSLPLPARVKICEEEHQAYQICLLDQLASLSLTPGLDECFSLAKQ